MSTAVPAYERAASKLLCPYRGTKGSNPACSSSESGANRDAGEGVCAQRGTTRGFRQAGGEVVPQWSCQQVGRPSLLGGARSSGGRGVGELHRDIGRRKADFSGFTAWDRQRRFGGGRDHHVSTAREQIALTRR